MHSNKPPIMR